MLCYAMHENKREWNHGKVETSLDGGAVVVKFGQALRSGEHILRMTLDILRRSTTPLI